MSFLTKNDFLCVIESWFTVEDSVNVLYGIKWGIITRDEVVAKFVAMVDAYCDTYQGEK